jgi:SPP1 family predicted phage head-tail adaptor
LPNLANKLDRRIIIQRATSVSDEFGAAIETWTNYLETWCSKTDVSDGERWRASEVQATITTRFLIRYNMYSSTVTPIDRILFEGLIYEISHVKEIDRRKAIEITASTRGD